MVEITQNSQLGYSASISQYRSVTSADFSYQSVSDDKSGVTGEQVSLSYFNIEETATYTSIGSVQSAADTAYDLLRSYVFDVFEKQGLDFTFSIDDETIDIRELSQEDAQALIAEDGYFGVEQTSDRIVDFAKGIAGNDPSRIDAILQGIEKGFNEALEAFGGWLPDISYSTYDRALEKLDNWVNEPQTA